MHWLSIIFHSKITLLYYDNDVVYHRHSRGTTESLSLPNSFLNLPEHSLKLHATINPFEFILPRSLNSPLLFLTPQRELNKSPPSRLWITDEDRLESIRHCAPCQTEPFLAGVRRDYCLCSFLNQRTHSAAALIFNSPHHISPIHYDYSRGSLSDRPAWSFSSLATCGGWWRRRDRRFVLQVNLDLRAPATRENGREDSDDAGLFGSTIFTTHDHHHHQSSCCGFTLWFISVRPQNVEKCQRELGLEKRDSENFLSPVFRKRYWDIILVSPPDILFGERELENLYQSIVGGLQETTTHSRQSLNTVRDIKREFLNRPQTGLWIELKATEEYQELNIFYYVIFNYNKCQLTIANCICNFSVDRGISF